MLASTETPNIVDWCSFAGSADSSGKSIKGKFRMALLLALYVITGQTAFSANK
jgi:hypothetical protein